MQRRIKTLYFFFHFTIYYKLNLDFYSYKTIYKIFISFKSILETMFSNKEDFLKKVKSRSLMPKLIQVPNLDNAISLESTDGKIISPFKNITKLSFAQRDKYIYELGWFLQHEYGDIFKNEWCYYKTFVDHSINYFTLENEKCTPEEKWENINTYNLYKDGFFYDLHVFAMKLMPKLFDRIIDLINEQVARTYIKRELILFINEEFIFDLIKDDISEYFFVNPSLSSYVYDNEKKLYFYNQSLSETLISLQTFLEPFITRIVVLSTYMNNMYNQMILDIVLNNIKSRAIQKKVVNLFVKRELINFNNSKQYEIAYKNCVMNLKNAELRLRNHNDYYTTTIINTYLKNYVDTPDFIMTIFGNDKDKLKSIQKTLGSLFIGNSYNKFIVFYGPNDYYKNILIHALKSIFNDYQLNIEMRSFFSEKKLKSIIEKFNFEYKKFIVLNNVPINDFLEDQGRLFHLINDKPYKFIMTTKCEITNLNLRIIQKNMTKILFRNRHKHETIKENLINRDYLFTWLVNGAIEFIKEEECNKQIEIELLSTSKYFNIIPFNNF